jgi:hypothetical protein
MPDTDRPEDDPSSAPESGTVREDSGGPPPERADKPGRTEQGDDPGTAGEER